MSHTFIKYLLRWQASGLILAPVMWVLYNWNPVIVAIIANLIGGILFYPVDKHILCGNKLSLKSILSWVYNIRK